MSAVLEEQVFLGCQPIIDRRQEVVAFELLFRAGASDGAAVTDDVVASASVLANTFSQLGLEQVLGNKLGFVNVSAELLSSELVDVLPRQRIVLELLETVAPTPAVLARCRALKQQGFVLAIDDVLDLGGCLPFLDVVDIVKVDVLQTGGAELARLAAALRRRPGLRLLAEKVETREMFETCLGLGFDLFQGYHFARPAVLTGRKIDPARSALVRLIGQIQHEADLRQIEETMLRHPALSINLLRLVNSVAIGGHRRFDSIRHAIQFLGLRHLQNWLQLLLYASSGEPQHVPLQMLAACRGKMMELLVAPERPDRRATAFMVGMLSLVDVLFAMPMQDVFKQISLSDEVQSALLARRGPLGRLLGLVEMTERLDLSPLHRASEAAGVDAARLTQAQVEALAWASNLKESR